MLPFKPHLLVDIVNFVNAKTKYKTNSEIITITVQTTTNNQVVIAQWLARRLATGAWRSQVQIPARGRIY